MIRPDHFEIDFHVHTFFSYDCPTPPRLVIEVARRKGLSGVAITDHGTVEGALATVDANRYPDFLVIPGIEVNTDIGDLIGLYIDRRIESYLFSDVIQEIHEKGGLAYVPHPIRTFGPERMKQVYAQNPEIDLWEMFNGRYTKTDFCLSRDAFAELGITSLSLCGSDAHFPWDIGRLRTALRAMPPDPETLRTLSRSAKLQAVPQGEIAVSASLALGAMTKAFKRREYRKLWRLATTLPFKATKKLMDRR
jgi:predicted metal-dependent phosphoesterase TrpH